MLKEEIRLIADAGASRVWQIRTADYLGSYISRKRIISGGLHAFASVLVRILLLS